MSFFLDWLRAGLGAVAVLVLLYLARVNVVLRAVPPDVRKLSGSRWTTRQLKSTYRGLQERPVDYQSKLPPRLERRYIVTGGNGERHSAKLVAPVENMQTAHAPNQASSAASSSSSFSPGARRRPTSGSSTSGPRSVPT